jgi:hypothetical protein
MHFEMGARGVRVLQLTGGAANVDIDGTSDSTIVADIALRSTDAERLKTVCLVRSRLDTATEGGVLRLAVHQESRDRCGETWRIRMPATLIARVQLDVGDLAVRGVVGGVHADIQHAGKITGTAGGNIDVAVGVGDIRLTSTRGDYELIDLTSDVGKARLSVGGYHVPPESRPGSRSHLRVTGRGSNQFRASSKVGNVEIQVRSSP